MIGSINKCGSVFGKTFDIIFHCGYFRIPFHTAIVLFIGFTGPFMLTKYNTLGGFCQVFHYVEATISTTNNQNGVI